MGKMKSETGHPSITITWSFYRCGRDDNSMDCSVDKTTVKIVRGILER